MIYIPKNPLKGAKQARSKYRNVKRKAHGQSWDSGGELARYRFLLSEKAAGRIYMLRCQVEFKLVVNGQLICKYRADFVYEVIENGAPVREVVEDFKGGYALPKDWAIKKKLMKELHGIDVRIVKTPTLPIG